MEKTRHQCCAITSAIRSDIIEIDPCTQQLMPAVRRRVKLRLVIHCLPHTPLQTKRRMSSRCTAAADTRTPPLLEHSPCLAAGVVAVDNDTLRATVRFKFADLAKPPILVYPNWDAVEDVTHPFRSTPMLVTMASGRLYLEPNRMTARFALSCLSAMYSRFRTQLD